MQAKVIPSPEARQQVDPTSAEWYKEPRRPIAEIIADLSKSIPSRYLDKLKDQSRATFIPWFHAVTLLDRCTGGHWDYEVKSITLSPDRIFVVVRITIHAQEGSFFREATGTEELKREVVDKDTGEIKIKELAYGEPSSNSESMALRRAAAKFGLGLYLYDKK